MERQPQNLVPPAAGDLAGSGGRRFDIDWLRIIAVLLLFPFHTARIFNLGEQFYVKNEQLSTALSYIISFMEPWHMPLFFLLAGASSWFALSRRSGRAYAGERVKRLLVPFLFGLIVLIPPQSYVGLISHGGTADSYLGWLPNFLNLNAADMDGYFLGGHTWGHLWFIIHLLLYSLIALPVMLFLRGRWGRRLLDRLAHAVRLRGVILLFCLLTLPAALVPEIAGGNPLWYTIMFLLGYVVVCDARFEQAIDRHKLVALLLGPVVLAALTYTEVTAVSLPAWARGPIEMYATFVVPWFCLITILGYGRRFLSFGSRALDYAAQAGYPVYILHQTAIVLIGYVVVQWQTGPAAKFISIMLLSLVASLVIYDLAVRRVNLLRFLFGMNMLKRSGAAAGRMAQRQTPPSTVSDLR